MTRRKGLVEQLEGFARELETYKHLVEQASKGSITVEEKTVKQSLHQKLLVQKGKLQPQIIGLIGHRYYLQFGQPNDPWLLALQQSAHSGHQLTSLGELIDFTYEAIGKLQDSGPSWVERTSLVYWADRLTPRLQQPWKWARLHRLKAAIGSFAAVITILGFFLKLFGVW